MDNKLLKKKKKRVRINKNIVPGTSEEEFTYLFEHHFHRTKKT